MDDLLDLSWSDSKKQDGGSKGSSFDLLAKSSNTGANYFSSSGKSTPQPSASSNVSSSNLASLNLAPRLASKNGSTAPTPARTQSPATTDAFSSLLGMSAGTDNQKLTMAEKQAQLAAKKAADAEAEKAKWGNGDFWNKLEGGSSGSVGIVAPQPQPVKSQMLAPLKPAASGSRPSSAAATTSKPATGGTFWDKHNDLLAPVNSSSRAATPASASSSSRPGSVQPSKPLQADLGWDDDDDDLLGGGAKPTQKTSSSSQPLNWEDDLLGGSTKSASKPKTPADPWDLDALASAVPPAQDSYGGDSDDDLLGELGRPARSVSIISGPSDKQPRRSPASHAQAQPQRPARNGTASPPPHIIGQIVEMGFPPDQARRALASTASGEDVQAALEMLLASRGNTPAPPPPPQDEDSEEEYVRKERERRARHAARRAGPSRDAIRPQQGEPREGEEAFDTERIVAQASEIGANMLSKATSFWNTSKEKALKVYEEQKRALDAQQAASRRKPPTDGRPRWMIEAEAAERGETLPPAAEFGDDSLGFQDDHSGDEAPPPIPRQQQKQPAPAPPPPQSVKERAASLFDDEPPRYVSKHRHAAGRSSSKPTPAQSRPASTRPASPLKQRTLVEATPKQISTAAEHKTTGNEHFKLGRFAEAEVSYSIAIASLPAGHLHLVPLYNNRAATRLKLGHAMPAVEDCGTVIDIIGPSYHPAKEAPVDSDVKLGEALVKATGKRAQAYEMAEKWKESLKDWERVMSYDSALGGSRSGANDGVKRAKAMLAGGSGSGSGGGSAPQLKAKPPPPRIKSRPADVHSSNAVGELRKAAQQAEKDDEERMALKDSVDARLEAWKKGKETNVRALLASLDTVLWDGVVTKVGMHELVTEKQVSRRPRQADSRLKSST